MKGEKIDPAAIKLSDRVRWSERQIAAEVGGQVVLLSLSQSNYCGLDDIASDVWRRIERPVTVASLCRDLELAYEAGPETIARDVLALLEQMREQGVIDVLE
jgi:hypothetical protein